MKFIKKILESDDLDDVLNYLNVFISSSKYNI